MPLDSPYIGNNMVLSVLHHRHQVPVEVSVDALLGVPSDVKVARMEPRVGRG